MDHQSKGMPPSPNLRAAWEKALEGQKLGILQSSCLTRKQRETLIRSGRLRAIMRGWYQLLEDPTLDTQAPDLKAFLPQYLENRLGSHWCLSAASSLSVRCLDGGLPSHVVVQSQFGSTTVHTFGDGTRLTVYQDENQLPTRLETIHGLRVMSPETILARLTAAQWEESLAMIDQLLPQISSWDGFVWQCLKEGRNQALYRLWQRFMTLDRPQEAEIVATGLKTAGLSLPKMDPAPETTAIPSKNIKAPQPEPSTLEECWAFWAEQIPRGRFRPNNLPGNLLHRLSCIENSLPEDARHHLRLAGFDIPTPAIEAIFMEPERAADSSGWPLLEEIQERLRGSDRPPLPGEVDPAALVALQGYAEALKLVKRSVVRMLEGRSLETILRQDMRGWRLALMSPSAEAGLIPHRQILRYEKREDRQHMDTWMKLVSAEEDPGRRGVLAFLGLARLAPWASGNRRMALLVLNALNTAAGLPWMVARRTEEFQTAWDDALRPAAVDRLLRLMVDSSLV